MWVMYASTWTSSEGDQTKPSSISSQYSSTQRGGVEISVEEAGRWMEGVRRELEEGDLDLPPTSRIHQMIRDLAAGTFDEDKYIISRRVDHFANQAVRSARQMKTEEEHKKDGYSIPRQPSPLPLPSRPASCRLPASTIHTHTHTHSYPSHHPSSKYINIHPPQPPSSSSQYPSFHPPPLFFHPTHSVHPPTTPIAPLFPREEEVKRRRKGSGRRSKKRSTNRKREMLIQNSQTSGERSSEADDSEVRQIGAKISGTRDREIKRRRDDERTEMEGRGDDGRRDTEMERDDERTETGRLGGDGERKESNERKEDNARVKIETEPRQGETEVERQDNEERTDENERQESDQGTEIRRMEDGDKSEEEEEEEEAEESDSYTSNNSKSQKSDQSSVSRDKSSSHNPTDEDEEESGEREENQQRGEHTEDEVNEEGGDGPNVKYFYIVTHKERRNEKDSRMRESQNDDAGVDIDRGRVSEPVNDEDRQQMDSEYDHPGGYDRGVLQEYSERRRDGDSDGDGEERNESYQPHRYVERRENDGEEESDDGEVSEKEMGAGESGENVEEEEGREMEERSPQDDLRRRILERVEDEMRGRVWRVMDSIESSLQPQPGMTREERRKKIVSVVEAVVRDLVQRKMNALAAAEKDIKEEKTEEEEEREEEKAEEEEEREEEKAEEKEEEEEGRSNYTYSSFATTSEQHSSKQIDERKSSETPSSRVPTPEPSHEEEEGRGRGDKHPTPPISPPAIPPQDPHVTQTPPPSPPVHQAAPHLSSPISTPSRSPPPTIQETPHAIPPPNTPSPAKMRTHTHSHTPDSSPAKRTEIIQVVSTPKPSPPLTPTSVEPPPLVHTPSTSPQPPQLPIPQDKGIQVHSPPQPITTNIRTTEDTHIRARPTTLSVEEEGEEDEHQRTPTLPATPSVICHTSPDVTMSSVMEAQVFDTTYQTVSEGEVVVVSEGVGGEILDEGSVGGEVTERDVGEVSHGANTSLEDGEVVRQTLPFPPPHDTHTLGKERSEGEVVRLEDNESTEYDLTFTDLGSIQEEGGDDIMTSHYTSTTTTTPTTPGNIEGGETFVADTESYSSGEALRVSVGASRVSGEVLRVSGEALRASGSSVASRIPIATRTFISGEASLISSEGRSPGTRISGRSEARRITIPDEGRRIAIKTARTSTAKMSTGQAKPSTSKVKGRRGPIEATWRPSEASKPPMTEATPSEGVSEEDMRELRRQNSLLLARLGVVGSSAFISGLDRGRSSSSSS
ncbi:hypothetical protein Pmani_021482 [Petrolisthes manimaculis]|uniref:Uncharacterized protein n=1 Tax=Petrolisthes manimaculis TaxID=1843537 RepID=A0AAE1PGK8_9EUCA|nr:hypothetical protein Pmani_021482 [Petrolisthes manimaculis]